jgi:hypothetical protein
VNIKAVLDIDEPTGRNFLSGRAIEALVDLVIVLVVSLVALTPSIARGALAAVILATAAISGISPVRSLRSGGGISAPDGAPKGAAVGRLVVAAALVVFFVLAGVTLAAAAVSTGWPWRSSSPSSSPPSTPGSCWSRSCADGRRTRRAGRLDTAARRHDPAP